MAMHYWQCIVYLNVPRPLDVLAVVTPVSGAAESLGAKLPLEDAGHLDTVLSLEHVTAVGDEVLHYTQTRIPVLRAGEILAKESFKYLGILDFHSVFYSLWKNHIHSS